MYREASEATKASGDDAIRPVLSPRESLSSSPVFHSRCFFFFLSLSFPALSLSVRLTDVRVFRARKRFRSLHAEGRLIVAPFLSAAFTAAGNPSRWKNEGRSKRRGTIDFSTVYVTTDQPLSSLVAFRELSISCSAYFLIRHEGTVGF